MNILKTDLIDQINCIVNLYVVAASYGSTSMYNFVKGNKNLFYIVATSVRESEENFDYDLLSSEKLRYFDFTTRLHRLATTNSSVLCHFGSNNGGVYIFVFKCTVRFQTRTRKYIHRFLENVCHDCSGFREFYHTSQLFILLSSGQTSTHPSSCLFLSFGYVEMIK